MDLSLLSPDAATLFGSLAATHPQLNLFSTLADRAALYPDLFSDTKIDMVGTLAGAEASARDMTLSLAASAGGGIYSGTATVKGALSDLKNLTGKVTFDGHHDDAFALLALAGVATLPVGAPGSATFEASAKGSFAAGFDLTTKITSEGLKASLSGRFSEQTDGLAGQGEGRFTASDAEPYLMATGVVLPDLGQGLAIDLTSSFTTSGPTTTLAGLSGQVAGIGITGDLSLENKQDRSQIGGTLALDRIDLSWLGEVLLGSGSLGTTDEKWPAVEFSTEGLVNLNGSVALEVKNADLRTLGELTDVRTNLVFGNNDLRLQSLSAIYQEGVLKGSLEAKNDKGTGLFNSDFSLTGAKFEKLLTQSHVFGLADISGSISATGKSADALAASVTGSGTTKLRDVTVSGINPAAFNEIFAIVGEREKAPASSEIEQLVMEHVQLGTVAVKDADLSWTAASGALRFSPLTASVEGGVLSASASADISKQTASIDGQFAYDAGGNAVTGAEPVIPYTLRLQDGQYAAQYDAQPLGQFLTQRALEREQARVEAMQEELLEGQRLRREARLYAYRAGERKRIELIGLQKAEEFRVRAAVKDWQKVLADKRAIEEAAERAAEQETQRLEDAAAQKAAEAALMQKPAPVPDELPTAPLQVTPPVQENLSAIDKLMKKLDFSTVPIQ